MISRKVKPGPERLYCLRLYDLLYDLARGPVMLYERFAFLKTDSFRQHDGNRPFEHRYYLTNR